MGELHAFLGKAVEVRRLVRGASIAREALNAEVIGENEDDVGLVCGKGLHSNAHKQEKNERRAARGEHSHFLLADFFLVEGTRFHVSGRAICLAASSLVSRAG